MLDQDTIMARNIGREVPQSFRALFSGSNPLPLHSPVPRLTAAQRATDSGKNFIHGNLPIDVDVASFTIIDRFVTQRDVHQR